MNWPWGNKNKSAESRADALKRLDGELTQLREDMGVVAHFDSPEFQACWKLIKNKLRSIRIDILYKMDAKAGEETNHAYNNGRLSELEKFEHLPKEIADEKRILLSTKNDLLKTEIAAQEEAVNLEYEP